MSGDPDAGLNGDSGGGGGGGGTELVAGMGAPVGGVIDELLAGGGGGGHLVGDDGSSSWRLSAESFWGRPGKTHDRDDQLFIIMFFLHSQGAHLILSIRSFCSRSLDDAAWIFSNHLMLRRWDSNPRQ